MGKGANTRVAILDQAIHIACDEGLEQVTFGNIAARLEMSKSGVHVHFRSIGNLQIDVVRTYARRFEQDVFEPVLVMPCGLARLQAVFANWCRHVSAGMGRDALYIYRAGGADERWEPVHDALTHAVRGWRTELAHCVKQAVELGQLDAATDPVQAAQEIYGLILLLHHDVRIFHDADAATRAARTFQRLLNRSSGARQMTSNRDIGFRETPFSIAA
ncbi:MAG: TetR/AcrR family transcriptional regulator [Noviherbaspirillum sp.]